MTPRIPEGCRHSGSRFEDAIEGSGMDSEDASDLADGLSLLNEPIARDRESHSKFEHWRRGTSLLPECSVQGFLFLPLFARLSL